jgi:hypothetical protein
MSILTRAWKPVAIITIGTMPLMGCLQPLPAETPREADSRVTNTVGAGAAVVCLFIKDYRQQRACFAAAALGASAAGDNARNQAARAGYCDDVRAGIKGQNNPVREYCLRRSTW